MIKKNIQTLLLATFMIAGMATFSAPAAYAADNWEVGSGNESRSEAGDTTTGRTCGGVETSIIACNVDGGEDNDGSAVIIHLLRYAIIIMTMGVGILAVAGVVYAGILYASAGGSQEQVKKAKMMLFNVALGLVAYAFMYAITNFLIPGGVFN